ncbi:unnamed protein product [Sphagnum balticum]
MLAGNGPTPLPDVCWKLLLKEEGFARHKSVDVTTPKEEAATSWRDLFIPLAAKRLKTLLSLLLQQLPDL